MDLGTRLTEHLQALSGRSDADVVRRTGEVAAGLLDLVGDLLAEVPSCLSVSIRLVRPLGDVTVSLPTAAVPAAQAVVRASLALPLTPAGNAELVLQAAEAGAFVLLADDLGRHRGPADLPLLLDRHLVLHADPDGDGLATQLADQRVVEQAVGALLGQGLEPERARRELQSRAAAAGLSTPALARQLLAGLSEQSSPGPGGGGTP